VRVMEEGGGRVCGFGGGRRGRKLGVKVRGTGGHWGCVKKGGLVVKGGGWGWVGGKGGVGLGGGGVFWGVEGGDVWEWD